jgi:hypothetical protein
MLKRMIILSWFIASLAIVSDMAAQVGSDDPVEAAARYVMEQRKLTGLGAGLVVDTETQIQAIGLHSRPLPPELQGRTRAIADSVQARAGALASHLRCPENPPVPEAMAKRYQGCQLIGGARVVLQVGPPEVEGDRAVVWVKTWTDIEDRRGRYVSAVAQQVELERDKGGRWWPLRVRRQSHARW